MSERKRLREQEAEECFDRQRAEYVAAEPPLASGCGGCGHADAIAAHREAKTSGLPPVGGLNPADAALWSTLDADS